MPELEASRDDPLPHKVVHVFHLPNSIASFTTSRVGRANKVVLFKFQNFNKSGKWGSWKIEEKLGDKQQVGESNYSDFGYLGQSALIPVAQSTWNLKRFVPWGIRPRRIHTL